MIYVAAIGAKAANPDQPVDLPGCNRAPVCDQVHLMQAIEIGTRCLVTNETCERQGAELLALYGGNASVLDPEILDFLRECRRVSVYIDNDGRGPSHDKVRKKCDPKCLTMVAVWLGNLSR